MRLDWEYKKGKYKTKEVDPQTCAVVAAKDAVPCTFQTKEGGTYRSTATIVDSKGRPNQTQADVLGLAAATSRPRARSKKKVVHWRAASWAEARIRTLSRGGPSLAEKRMAVLCRHQVSGWVTCSAVAAP